MNVALLQPDVRDYLMTHLHTRPAAFMLMSHQFEIAAKDLTQQLVGLQKARYKFPLLFENEEVLYPPKVHIEQTSSWHTARYKAQITKGKSMVDLTGGLGIDGLAFAEAFSQTTHVEVDHKLQAIASHNFAALGTRIKSYNDDGIAYLKKTNNRYDLIYLDPSRKTAATHKAILLEDYEPNVLSHLELLFQKADQVLIKTSPMLDITAGLQQLQHVAQIHVVAVKNEVKELLWLLKPGANATKITAVNLESGQIDFTYDHDKTCDPIIEPPGNYLYEPHAALMKTQAYGVICEQFNLGKIDTDSHFYTSNKLITFPGRCFKIIGIHDYKPKIIKRLYSKSARAVVARNFRESVHQLRTKYNFTEHESDYLFFTCVAGRGAVVIEAQKIET